MIKPESVKEGCLISIDMIPGTAPCSCYIGLTKTADKNGIRMSPARWDELNGIRLSKADIHIPWMNVKSVLICTD